MIVLLLLQLAIADDLADLVVVDPAEDLESVEQLQAIRSDLEKALQLLQAVEAEPVPVEAEPVEPVPVEVEPVEPVDADGLAEG